MDKAALESTAKLQEAIRTLEAYSSRKTASHQTSSIAKTIAQVRAIFAHRSDPKPTQKKHQQLSPNSHDMLRAVERAVELINRHRIVIQQLKKGTPAEQRLADEFTRTIDTYNESCNKLIPEYVSTINRLAKFFSKDQQIEKKLPTIILPRKATVQCHYPEQLATQDLPNPPFAEQECVVPIPKQSAELFHMKAIALLERYGIATNSEARVSVKQSPIYTSVEKHSSICTLRQTITLFPGQTITVIGASALDPKSHAISRLFPETFRLSLESTQTGCPHPLQRAGWTMASQLLPEFPQRIDLLKEATPLFQGRTRAVIGLSPPGGMLKRAKEMISLKKRCFDQHAQELLNLHKQLAFSIAEDFISDKMHLEQFFNHLSTLSHPFQYLSHTSQMIRESFIAEPHQMLLDAIIKGKSTDFGSPFPHTRYMAAKTLLDQAFETAKDKVRQQKIGAPSSAEKIRLDYVLCMGEILGQAAKQIILQYLSEDLVFQPPILTSFERKVQAAAYHHLGEFLLELSPPSHPPQSFNLAETYKILKTQVETDIAFFQEEKKLTIPQELADYFQERYDNLMSLPS